MLYLICSILISMTGGYAGSEDLAALLPADGIPEGWAAMEAHRVYDGGALYSHINGGAELYHKHGFVSLVLKDYAKGDLEVRVEIYDMGTPEGAKGVFAENTLGLETGKEYGEGCSLDPLQIIFHRDRFYVSVTCYDANEELEKAMDALTSAVDGKIIDSGK